MNNAFVALGLNEKLGSVLQRNRIVEPTPIQEKSIPHLLEGKDLIAQAQTGTGKTFAFMLPIMEKLDVKDRSVQALIITPTRELALQITKEAQKLTQAGGGQVLAVYGGQGIDGQIKKLRRGVQIVVGTPGRLLDHLNRGTLNLSKLSTLVLDEADQMLHMGFLPDVEKIIKQTPDSRQTLFFSATMPAPIRSLSKRYMNAPEEIEAKGKNVTLDTIDQRVIETSDRMKQEALMQAIKNDNPFMAIVFCRTKRRTKALGKALNLKGIRAEEIHGDLTQAKRERALKAFRKSRVQILVATDVVARGLDIDGITHVYNYDIPGDAESYIHRIGRTGRAGQKGEAITLIAPGDHAMLRTIEKTIGMPIEGSDKLTSATRSNRGNGRKRHGNYKGNRSGQGRTTNSRRKTS